MFDPNCPLDATAEEREARAAILRRDQCPDCRRHVDGCACDEDSWMHAGNNYSAASQD